MQGFFQLRLHRALLERSSHHPALHRLRWAPVINQWVHGFILTILGKATELRHLQGRKIKGGHVNSSGNSTLMPRTNTETDEEFDCTTNTLICIIIRIYRFELVWFFSLTTFRMSVVFLDQ